MLSSMRIQVPGSAGEEHGLVPSSEQQGAGDAGFGADARAWRGSAGAARGAGGEEPPLLVLQPSQAAAMLSSLARLSHRDDAACAAVAREMQRAVRSSPEQVRGHGRVAAGWWQRGCGIVFAYSLATHCLSACSRCTLCDGSIGGSILILIACNQGVTC